MNLSVLERMVRSGDMSADAMRYLVGCGGECEWLDHKAALRLENEKERCDFTRDVLGMKNVGGGYIVVGVEDGTWKPVGLAGRLRYDTKMLRDKIRGTAGVELDVDIVHHSLQLPSSTGLFALILVRSSKKRKKRRSPTVAGKDACPSRPFGLRRGDIYVRKGDSTVRVNSQAELEDLLEALEAEADQDALVTAGQSSPFAIEDGTYRLLEKGFEQFIGRDALRQQVLDAITKDPRIWIVNVHGPGGVGKSAVVNWAAHEFYAGRGFEAILQLTAKETVLTPAGIIPATRSLYSLENLLDHILRTFEEPTTADLAGKKALAVELLSAWKLLLVLDNLETVQDGRILEFVQNLPVEAKAKVVMTSRQKTGGWELPVPVTELTPDEVHQFLRVRVDEMGMTCRVDQRVARKVWEASGGLPLAIQWILGRCRLTGSIASAIWEVREKDSPVLEFSFRNIWNVLSPDARIVLAVMTIFDEPPTLQQLSIASEYSTERVERALGELADVTLVTKNTQMSDGTIRYVALPITLDFAEHQLHAMGDLEVSCRQRHQRFTEQMELRDSELRRFQSRFERFGLTDENEKRAAILCQRAESELSAGNVDAADTMFRQARNLAPQSAYVHAMSASYELNRNRIGTALSSIEEACARADKRTGALCYSIKARIMDAQHDKTGRIQALEKALEYAPDDHITRHQYGVALSRAGRTQEAVHQFTRIADEEKGKVPPTLQLLMALKTRIINLRRLGKSGDAEQDLRDAKKIIADNPHLAYEAHEFAEFDDTESE
jgi:tetratricopeptide (TPR) repeat protein